ncbi:hypothetical protein LTR95_009070 [Oleoguttula sp. CCFEE 5521]
MKTFTPSILALIAAVASADVCKLTAFATLGSGLNLGGSSLTETGGFIFQINDDAPLQVTPNKGNGYPDNYGCPSDPQLYGAANFDGLGKSGVGMCLIDVKAETFPTQGFNCQGLTGDAFTGETNSEFYGAGNSNNAHCTVDMRNGMHLKIETLALREGYVTRARPFPQSSTAQVEPSSGPSRNDKRDEWF